MYEFFTEIKSWAIRLKNKIRILWIERFTNRVQRFVVEDKETGAKHEVVVEKELEKVCDHKKIEEIAPTMWKCSTPGCPTYFQIGYKVMLTDQDLVKYLDQLATHLKLTLEHNA